ncbi:MAG: hypothetical protein ACR2RL_22320 [Gammaproteobacteria bacterium]
MKFVPGIYHFSEVLMAKNNKIVFDVRSGSAVINLRSKIGLENDVEILASEPHDDAAGTILFQVTEGYVAPRSEFKVLGTLLAPGDEIALGEGATATGAFLANEVSIGRNGKMNIRPATTALRDASVHWLGAEGCSG